MSHGQVPRWPVFYPRMKYRARARHQRAGLNLSLPRFDEPWTARLFKSQPSQGDSL